jgi:hypothetical protein
LDDSRAISSMCLPDSCLNDGRCIPMNNSVICACEIGYYGPKCEFKLNTFRTEACLTNVCQNNGICSIKKGRGKFWLLIF